METPEKVAHDTITEHKEVLDMNDVVVLDENDNMITYNGLEYLELLMTKTLISRDTYWKERVEAIKKLYEDQCVEEIGFVVKGDKVWEALDNLK
jgi:hypothetical protein